MCACHAPNRKHEQLPLPSRAPTCNTRYTPEQSIALPLAVCCSVLRCVAVCCGVLQCVAVCYSVLQYVARQCTHLSKESLSHLQFVAVCCNTRYTPEQSIALPLAVRCSVLHCVAVCCSVLQCVAVRCRLLQYVATKGTHLSKVSLSCLQCVAVRCSVLQCVAVCCSVLQCVTVIRT